MCVYIGRLTVPPTWWGNLGHTASRKSGRVHKNHLPAAWMKLVCMYEGFYNRVALFSRHRAHFHVFGILFLFLFPS